MHTISRMPGYFPTKAGPRRRYQDRLEQKIARDARRLRLLQLIGSESLVRRAMGYYRGTDKLLGLGGSGGYSQAELAELLWQEGHCGRDGGPVSQSTISRDLRLLMRWAKLGSLSTPPPPSEESDPVSPLTSGAAGAVRLTEEGQGS